MIYKILRKWKLPTSLQAKSEGTYGMSVHLFTFQCKMMVTIHCYRVYVHVTMDMGGVYSTEGV